MSETSRSVLKFVASALLGFCLVTFAHGLLPSIAVAIGTAIACFAIFVIGANSDELMPVVVCIVGMILAAIVGLMP
jgi:hypothetical protein